MNFDLVYGKYHLFVFRYARKLCRDEQLAEDVAADVFVKLMEQAAKGNVPQSNIRSYILQTAYTSLVDYFRDRYGDGEDLKLALNVPESKHRRPVEHAVDDETDLRASLVEAKNLLPLVQSLPQTARHVVVLRLMEGYSLKETAQLLGTTDNNVKIIQYRALTRIREFLGVEVEKLGRGSTDRAGSGLCANKDCDKKRVKQSYCEKHYRENQRRYQSKRRRSEARWEI